MLPLFPESDPEVQALSVWELTAQIKGLLETTFPAVCVVGEICDLARPRSGHCYLTLKDDRAQIRAVIWRGVLGRVRFDLHDGLAVVCRGHIDVYAPRGSYQLLIEQIEPKGIGALKLAFRQLRDRLAREGLFDPARKRPLPRFARRIGLVTSPTGAAIHDFLQVLVRRWRGSDVLVVPVRVQGDGAAQEIAAAIEQLNRMPQPVDCLVVTRGGGSLEDLWAFNEEVVVRAIHASRIPVVSAVGHEIDVTLSDLVADVRALTPSEAGELVAPSADEIADRLRQDRGRLLAAMRGRLTAAGSKLDALARHHAFRRPYARILELGRRLDELETRLARDARRHVQQAQQKMAAVAARLESLSPLAVLRRGYSLTQHAADGRIVRDASALTVGEAIVTRLAAGRTVSRVESIDGQ